jgi:hypothetical protein
MGGEVDSLVSSHFDGDHAPHCQHTARRDAFRLAYAAHFRSHNIDVVLSPYGPCPAPPLGTARYWSYTSIFNLVDYPAAVFPTGVKVEGGDVEAPRRYRNSADEENARNCECVLKSGDVNCSCHRLASAHPPTPYQTTRIRASMHRSPFSS